MRIWSFHPKYLDARGLSAVWRETLLAQKALKGETRGYRNHPQLRRFRACPDPAGAAAAYLQEIAREAKSRGYRFDSTKIGAAWEGEIPCTSGQLSFEWLHFRNKCRSRSESWFRSIESTETPDPHPLFAVFPGQIEDWERGVILQSG